MVRLKHHTLCAFSLCWNVCFGCESSWQCKVTIALIRGEEQKVANMCVKLSAAKIIQKIGKYFEAGRNLLEMV